MERMILSLVRQRACDARVPHRRKVRLSPIVSMLMLLWLVLQSLASAPVAAASAQENFCFSLAEPNDVCISEATYRSDVCNAIAAYANFWGLPAGFFARLIWQESRFEPTALSPAGAEGIAQFMPDTGELRGLKNPFDPAEALARSAEYLRFLELKFGNLGLAAAAYNGGEGRIGRYVTNGGGALPIETRNFVFIITGLSADQWLAGSAGEVDYTLDEGAAFQAACLDMAKSVSAPDFTISPAEWQPWGVLLAQNASADLARSRFAGVQGQFSNLLGEEQLMLISVRNPSFGNRLRYSAMIGRQTRQEADELCALLIDMEGNCVVRKNER